MDLAKYIRDINDYPKEGIIFKDLTPLWQSNEALRYAVDTLADTVKHESIDLIVGAESRGFLIGAAMAYKMNVGFIPVRKKGKLPWKTISAEYELEYGTDTLFMHQDAIKKGDKILIVDDLIATGGTSLAMIEMSEKLGGIIVGSAFIVELAFLKGCEKINKYPTYSLLKY